MSKSSKRVATMSTADLVAAADFAERFLAMVADAEAIMPVLGRLSDGGIQCAGFAHDCLLNANLAVLDTALNEIVEGIDIRVQVAR